MTCPDMSPINMRAGGGKFFAIEHIREATKVNSTLSFLVLFLAP